MIVVLWFDALISITSIEIEWILVASTCSVYKIPFENSMNFHRTENQIEDFSSNDQITTITGRYSSRLRTISLIELLHPEPLTNLIVMSNGRVKDSYCSSMRPLVIPDCLIWASNSRQIQTKVKKPWSNRFALYIVQSCNRILSVGDCAMCCHCTEIND